MAPSPSRPPIVYCLSSTGDEVPVWAADEFELQRKNVAQLEITSTSTPLYNVLLKYIAQRGVDVHEKAPKLADRLHCDSTSEKREYPGVLTSLYNPPRGMEDIWESYNRKDDDEEEKPQRPTYMFGLGWARIKTNPLEKSRTNGVSHPFEEASTDDELIEDHENGALDITTNGTKKEALEDPLEDASSAENHLPPIAGEDDVLVEHYAMGDPAAQNYRLTLYRLVKLYAADIRIIRQLCREALHWGHDHEQRMLKAAQGKFVLYTLKVSNCDDPPRWICHGHKKSRSLKSIILPKGAMSSIVDDFEEFVRPDTKRWYTEHGLPYRRNYLFYGPPGGGKTSTVKAIAGQLKLKACFMTLSHRSLGDHTLHEALSKIPRPCILVLEDIDVLFNEDRKSSTESTLTFSGLLNAIDGLVSSDGIIMVMTTNHINRLDPALIRAGRVDRRFEFKMPSMEEITNLFLSFYPKASRPLAQTFAECVFDRKEKEARSIATLQQHFIYTRHNTAEESLKKLEEFFSAFYPNGGLPDKSVLYC